MIAKIQPARKHSSSAKRLQEYLTTVRGSLTQETEQSFEILQNGLNKPAPNATSKRKLRGDVVLSSNLLGLDTSAYEMEGVAANNPRCKDPILHYELAWPHDEHPTKEQWKDSALQTLAALGYAEHQYLIAAHEDRKHFHIHVMVNTVHPETFRVNNPRQSWTILDKTSRRLEAIYGWKHTPGLTRWDDEAQEAIRLKRSERQATENTPLRPTSGAARFEHYNDVQSLQTYIRHEVAPSVRNLLARKKVQWVDLHTLLAKAHLRLEKGETGGYTVVAVDYGIRVKASDVFRNDFAGKVNRERVEQLLGHWSSPLELRRGVNDTDRQEEGGGQRELYVDAKLAVAATPQDTNAPATRKSTLRDENRRQQGRAIREAERRALKSEYSEYRAERLAVCREITIDGRTERQKLTATLRLRKQEIRASQDSWASKKAFISRENAEVVIEAHAIKTTTRKKRRAAWPKSYREWVADKATTGDARAAAQLRGWHYQDQRNLRRLGDRLESTALHFQPPRDKEGNSVEWAEFMRVQPAAMEQKSSVEQQIAAVRISEVNRRTGDVSYSMEGKIAVVDRGKMVSVLNQEEAAIVFGLEMSIRKYGARLECQGTVEWKRAVVMAAVRYGITVQFIDPVMAQMNAELRRVPNQAEPFERPRVILRKQNAMTR